VTACRANCAAPGNLRSCFPPWSDHLDRLARCCIAQLSGLHFGGPLSLPEEQMDVMIERVRAIDPTWSCSPAT
jgi:hypothetical protein